MSCFVILSNRHYSERDPWRRFLRGTPEGAAAVQADGRGVLRGAERETFLQSAGGIHVQVRLSPPLPNSRDQLKFFLGSTFHDNLNDSESSRSQFHCLHTDRCTDRDIFRSGWSLRWAVTQVLSHKIGRTMGRTGAVWAGELHPSEIENLRNSLRGLLV